MKIGFIFLVFIFLSAGDCLAQDGLVWMEFFDADSGANWEQFYDVYATTDNEYIVVGHSNCFIIVIKYNEDGGVIWSRTYGDGGYDIGKSVVECDNGDYVIGGLLAETGRTTNLMGMRLSEDGEVIWMIDYGVGSCSAVIELKDGRFALAGEVGDNTAGIIIITGDGEEVNRRAYPHGANSSFRAIRESDEGIVGVCQWRSGRTWMAEVDFELEPRWIQDYDFANARSVRVWQNSLVSTNGGYAFCVTVVEEGGGNIHRPEVLTTDLEGQLLWRQRYNLRNEPYETNAIFNTVQQGLILAGGQSVASLMNIDNRGGVQWQSSYYTERGEDYESTWFTSVTLDRNTDIIACGLGMNRNFRQGCGVIAKIDGLQLQPLVLEWSPRDSMLTVLPSDTIEFAIHAQARNEDALRLEYWVQDTLFAEENTIIVPFDSLGVFLVEGRVFYEESITSIRWHVTATDLFIAYYSPDTLSLSLRRGTSQTFSLDSVAAVEGDPITYQWTLTDLNSFEAEDAGMETGATVDFLRSGNFQLEGLAYRGESSDNVVWTISVRSAILDFTPRSLALATYRDSTLQFSLLPFNPESDSLKYSWLLDGTVSETDTLDYLSFTFSQSGEHQISGILLDGAEGDTINWTVTVEEPGEVDKWSSGQVDKYVLLSTYPNPFNCTTTIRFSVPSSSSSSSSLTLHDLSGRQVRECVSAEVQAGEHTYILNGEDLPAGIYLIRLKTGSFTKVNKVVLVR